VAPAPADADIDLNVTLEAMLAPGNDRGRLDEADGAQITGYVIDIS
jgi:hypothetical protein